jgi:hypothetical protein
LLKGAEDRRGPFVGRGWGDSFYFSGAQDDNTRLRFYSRIRALLQLINPTLINPTLFNLARIVTEC